MSILDINDGWLYQSQVMHRRVFPVQYQFVYRVFSLLVDIDRIPELTQRLKLLSFNRFNLLSLYTKDHGPRDGTPWRTWIDAYLGEQGIDLEGGRVFLLCFPRVLGYTFNPLSLWYCHHQDGSLRAIICEVRNTLGDCHHYTLHNDGKPLHWPVVAGEDKRFYVSPFIDMDAHYDFRLAEPSERLSVLIRESQKDEIMLVASQTGNQRPLCDSQLARLSFRLPLLGFKIIGGIHWWALKIWLMGGKYHKKRGTTP
ncbi:hypothetical protein SAMN05216526_0496 [Ectothiorhodosinus mongolicus]|uniref:DUF1365 domain-containing protein n=1 Tax=Ectothiorhodosinus mongolicus TaxID=233100 RepID=A0A1R3VNH8_9GAMM|nr:DUF1365 domain-containing protein [Ectothiorhodosinus mongolicus]SIT66155.1 hypothetical protein SAMN05216526_0496 [Ectothiorhodosinus mongolicus]